MTTGWSGSTARSTPRRRDPSPGLRTVGFPPPDSTRGVSFPFDSAPVRSRLVATRSVSATRPSGAGVRVDWRWRVGRSIPGPRSAVDRPRIRAGSRSEGPRKTVLIGRFCRRRSRFCPREVDRRGTRKFYTAISNSAIGSRERASGAARRKRDTSERGGTAGGSVERRGSPRGWSGMRIPDSRRPVSDRATARPTDGTTPDRAVAGDPPTV